MRPIQRRTAAMAAAVAARKAKTGVDRTPAVSDVLTCLGCGVFVVNDEQHQSYHARLAGRARGQPPTPARPIVRAYQAAALTGGVAVRRWLDSLDRTVTTVCLECGGYVSDDRTHASFHHRLKPVDVHMARPDVPFGQLARFGWLEKCNDCGAVLFAHRGRDTHSRFHYAHDPREFGMARA